MRIGLDFDNTIVSYDQLFHKIALEQGVVPEHTPVNKVAVRDYLRSQGRESIWTQMQGTVYGARMGEALAYLGVKDFLRQAQAIGHTVAIISHKTKHPFLGPQYDLHAAAQAWVNQHLRDDNQPLIPADQIFFELTKEAKLSRIAAFECDLFLDDLPEILQADSFPARTCGILFDPEANHRLDNLSGTLFVRSWSEFADFLKQ